MIVHIIPSLEAGGAEKFLLGFLSKENSACRVIVLKGRGTYTNEFEAIGIKVSHLYLHKAKLKNLIKIVYELVKQKPKKIICWLSYAQIFGFLVGLLLKETKLIFMYRQSIHNYLDLSLYQKGLVRVACLLMKHADAAIFNSNASKEQFFYFGAAPRKSIVLHNGVDKEKFRFDLNLRQKCRKNLKLTDNDFVVLWVGRWHREKGTDFALKLAAKIVNRNQKIHFIFVGRQSEEFLHLKKPLEGNRQVIWSEITNDIADYVNAADLLISTSRSESCPNVVLEAVANSLPVVATNVGDIDCFVAPENLFEFGDFASFTKRILEVEKSRSSRQHRDGLFLSKIKNSDECFSELEKHIQAC